MTKFNLFLCIVAIYLISLVFFEAPNKPITTYSEQHKSAPPSLIFSQDLEPQYASKLIKSDAWRVEEYLKSVKERLSLNDEQTSRVKEEFKREVSGRYLSIDQRKRVVERALGDEYAKEYLEALELEEKSRESDAIDSELGRLLLKVSLSEKEKELVREVLLQSRQRIKIKLNQKNELLEEMMAKHFDEDKTPLQSGYQKLTELNDEIKKERLEFIFDNLPQELAKELSGVIE